MCVCVSCVCVCFMCVCVFHVCVFHVCVSVVFVYKKGRGGEANLRINLTQWNCGLKEFRFKMFFDIMIYEK